MAYTKEETQNIVTKYKQALESGVDTVAAVKQIAKDEGRTVAMVRSKLVAEKVYQVPEKKEVTPKERVTKAALVSQLEKVTGLKLVSLEKANMSDLKNLVEHVCM